jgi:hypothetical protein
MTLYQKLNQSRDLVAIGINKLWGLNVECS